MWEWRSRTRPFSSLPETVLASHHLRRCLSTTARRTSKQPAPWDFKRSFSKRPRAYAETAVSRYCEIRKTHARSSMSPRREATSTKLARNGVDVPRTSPRVHPATRCGFPIARSQRLAMTKTASLVSPPKVRRRAASPSLISRIKSI